METETPVAEGAAAQEAVCNVVFCPICTMVAAVGEVKPELIEHLLAAGREVLLALRSLIDSRLQTTETSARLERVPIQ